MTTTEMKTLIILSKVDEPNRIMLEAQEVRRFKSNIERASKFGYRIHLSRIHGSSFLFQKISEGNRAEYVKYARELPKEIKKS